jgi:5'-3' exonuclease
MGIPYYFYSLTQKYQNILVNTDTILNIKSDLLCLDYNGIIHTVIQDCMNKCIIDETKFIHTIWEKTEAYLSLLKPKEVLICIDGVAPLAKMAQQRKRRYLSVLKNKIDNIETKWDTNAITTGSDFMNKINAYIKTKVKYNTSDINIIFSGCDENGEGEHKIFHKLLTLQHTDTKHILIHGLDADLIILSLMSHKHNIYLMRESTQNQYTYLNITELRKALIKELVFVWCLQQSNYEDIYSIESRELIESYCVMCSILGNDFIPHLCTVNLKTDGMDKLLKCTKHSIINHGMLIINGSINHDCLANIFIELSKNEDNDIHNECEKYIKKQIHNVTDNVSDLYAIKHKDPLLHIIYNNPTRWRQEYYKSLFDTNITYCSLVVSEACENFIKGIYWTYAYYKRYHIDHLWYYPYTYTPTIKDIANYCIAYKKPEIQKRGNYVANHIQLLIVLPKESRHLLADKYKKYMEDVKHGLYHMYPEKYKVQTFLKTHLWECSPILPTINIEYLLKLVH